MDTGSGSGDTLFITFWGDDKLYSMTLNTSTWALGDQVELGSCTDTELDNGTYYAAPFTPTFDDSLVYIFGRMASPAGLSGTQHLIVSSDTGATFSSKVSSLGTSVLTNFRAEGETTGSRTFYGIVSASAATPKFYRGTETLTYVSDCTGLPNGLVNVDAFAVAIPPESATPSAISVGSNTAQSVMVVQSTDNGANWVDITLNLPTTGEIKTCVVV